MPSRGELLLLAHDIHFARRTTWSEAAVSSCSPSFGLVLWAEVLNNRQLPKP